MHLTVKDLFSLDDYYANSVVQEANAIQQSLIELNKLYKKNKEEQVKSIKSKIKKVKSRLTTLTKIKKSFVSGQHSFPKNSNIKMLGNFFVVQFKRKTDLYYHAYHFEHGFLDKEIKKLENRIGFLIFKQNRVEKELNRLKMKISSVVFGSKKLFKSQYTKDEYVNDHSAWARKWDRSRYNQMMISGRKDSGSGNFVFKYSLDEKILRFNTPSGVNIQIENLIFPYSQEKVEAAIQRQMNCKDKKKFEDLLVGQWKTMENTIFSNVS